MEKNIKGILIDAEKRTVKEVQVIGDYKAIYPFLGVGVDCFALVGINDTESIYVDDEGLLKNPRNFILFKGYRGALAGNGLILGSNEEGESISTSLTVEWVKKQVKFADYLTVGLMAKMGALD